MPSLPGLKFLMDLGKGIKLMSTKLYGGSWRDGSMGKHSGCSCRAPWFDPQQLHDGSQSSLTSVPGHPMPSCNFFKHQSHEWFTDIQAQNTSWLNFKKYMLIYIHFDYWVKIIKTRVCFSFISVFISTICV